jgi:hypothetical protein
MTPFEDREDIIDLFQKRNLLFRTEKVELYAIDTRQFVDNITLWSNQRNLDEAHVLSLIDSFTNNKFFIGTFKVVREIHSGESRLIDGMHRLSALTQIVKMNPTYTDKVIVEVYNVKDMSSRETLELFKQANNCLNFTIDNSPDEKTHSIVEKFCLRFPNMIIDRTRTKRPKMTKREFYVNVKNMVNSFPEKCESEIELMINTINFKMSKEIFDVTMNMFETAKENNFFLSLEKNWFRFLE